MLWLLALVPVALVAAKLVPTAHTLLFVLSVLAIVPLAALLSHATESVAEKTGDAVGGLLNATLGNLTELVIAAAALRAGEYALVKGSIAGAIVTNTLFMLGASFFQASHPGVQPRYRTSRCGFALSGRDCARKSLCDRQSRFGARHRPEPEAQPRLSRTADRWIRFGFIVLA